MNIIKTVLNKYKQKNNKEYFENRLQQACQYKLIDFGQ